VKGISRSGPRWGRNIAVLGALLALGVGTGGYVLSQQRVQLPWEDRFVFQATFAETAGISPGNGQEVRIAGVPVGEISDARVDADGNAVIEMDISGEHEIYDNARIVMRPKSPLNEIFVNVDPGGPPGQPLAEGAVLPITSSQRAIQVDEVLGHLDTNTQHALTTLLVESDVALASAPTHLPAGLQATDALLVEIQPAVVALEGRREELARLVSALSEISTAAGRDDARLAELTDDLATTLGVLAAKDADLDASLAALPGFTDALRTATDDVTELAGELDPTLRGLRDASDELPRALDRLTGAVQTADDVLDEAEPFLAELKPVARDLRPFVDGLDDALDDLRPISADFDPLTAKLLPYLTDLNAFVHNTNSMTSMHDVNKGILRGQATFGPTSLPLPLGGFATPTPDEGE
jgi:phospholipid/cholesterol/gamma-HCH transport system substrate-binding protein